MDRQIKGIIAATLAAPYVASLLMALWIVLFEPRVPDPFFAERLFKDVIFLGTVGLLYAGLPILILALIGAGILNGLKLRSGVASLFSGSIVGLIFGAFFNASGLRDNIHLTLIFVVSGAICGWIYWAIAIGRTPRNGHAIEAE